MWHGSPAISSNGLREPKQTLFWTLEGVFPKHFYSLLLSWRSHYTSGGYTSLLVAIFYFYLRHSISCPDISKRPYRLEN
jgi:hypothetical protein